VSGERLPAIGSLRDRVQVQRRDMNGEGEGGHAVVFMPMGTAWARVRSLSARQGQVEEGRGVSISHSVVLRYRADIKPGDRFVYRDRKLEVISAEDLNGRRAYLSCACSENAITG
jgi:SPP1 family predicted phage head-tail adaptor